MKKILVVEDELIIRNDIVEELECQGYDVLQACDGAEGLASIIANKPDIVLSDITMPKMNGHEMLITLRNNHPDLADIPIVFLSALADRQDIIKGKLLGADDYLTKPIDYEMMLATVNSRLRQVKRMEQRKLSQLLKLHAALSRTPGQAADSMPAAPPEEIPQMTVVTISNHEVDLSEIKVKLEGQNHRVIEMDSGVVFQASLDNIAPDLVLVSLNTTDMRASMMVRLIKAKRECAFPIVLLVPPTKQNQLNPSHESWFDAIIQMPCSGDEFTAQINALDTGTGAPVLMAS
ncbi:MAG: response regulator [Rhizobiales bacterium]|nr:response regulator [Hyphomicrobiales bacterium]